jgi:FMN reductase
LYTGGIGGRGKPIQEMEAMVQRNEQTGRAAKPIKVVGLGGSLATPSTSLAALKVALSGAADAAAETQLLDIRALDLPLYIPGTTEVPGAARELADAAYQADGLLWSSPMYHGTVSGAFKNALDWLQLLVDRTPPYLTDKVIGLIGTAGGVQGLQAVITMQFVVRALRGWAVPLVMPIPRAWEAFDEAGQPRDARTGEQLQALGREVVRAARQMSVHGYCDYSEPREEHNPQAPS